MQRITLNLQTIHRPSPPTIPPSQPHKALPPHTPTPTTHPTPVPKNPSPHTKAITLPSTPVQKPISQSVKPIVKAKRARKIKKSKKHKKYKKYKKRKKYAKHPKYPASHKPKRSRLANALLGAATTIPHTPTASSTTERMIHRLYGREFDHLTPTQKRFIRNHLSEIHRITQNTLSRNGYPNVAVRTRQQGVNIVTFYLHPNGDITGLRLKRSMGYRALDKNTLEVIRIAYMHYPHPKTTTKITFYVNYKLY